tara:strand:+ start:148 stop:717 length:570 start_codon:yes stop_codon:yes gene_type:complete
MSFMLLGILNAQAAGGGGAGAYELLESVTLSTDTASVTFDNLDSYSDYQHLQIRAVGQVNETNDGLHNIFMRLNSDTGNNYGQHGLYGEGSSVVSFGYGSQSFMYARNVFGSKANTAYAGSVVIDFLDIHSSSKNTTMRAFGGATQPGEKQIGITSGLWNNTAAVTTILLYLNSGSFSAGARFSLIGIR